MMEAHIQEVEGQFKNIFSKYSTKRVKHEDKFIYDGSSHPRS